jgi:hypothetical protein
MVQIITGVLVYFSINMIHKNEGYKEVMGMLNVIKLKVKKPKK